MSETLLEPRKPWLFNAETAVIAAKKSHEPNSARFVRPPEPSVIVAELQNDDVWRRQRLAFARKEVERLDGLISKETDPKKLRDLHAALDLASKREGNLANRPLPGTLRPTSKTSKRQADPISEPEPAPQVTSEAKPKGYDGPETG